ncbi:MAG TPA: type IV secretion system DNA-binding domain-containing protein [Candidatus Woesebacteria bacterium]|nr:type IV secretion system DNA-binding domain-containing protein [Candidatus Woesebacteria bacterium]
MFQQVSYLQIRTAKDDETKPDAAQQLFSSLLPAHVGLVKRALFGIPRTYGFEIYLLGQTVYFYAVCPHRKETFVKSLVQSAYPKSSLVATTDPLDIVLKSKLLLPAEMQLARPYYLPIRTYKELGDMDSLTSLLGFLSKQGPETRVAIQILVSQTHFNWQRSAKSHGKQKVYDAEKGTYSEKQVESTSLIGTKAALPGGKVAFRLIAGTDNTELGYEALESVISGIAGTYGALGIGEGNQFKLRKVLVTKKAFIKRAKARKTMFFEKKNQILNAAELATIWHPTGKSVSGIKNIRWGKQLPGEPPISLPVASHMGDEEKQKTNFFARTEFKNEDTIFGIKEIDRRRHMYIIGKTGAGKSTLIANMAIDDIRRGRGIGIIDPHGDLAETILDYIPKRRMNDVVYLEPFDTERPFSLNVLEVKHQQHRDLISSGIVAIFGKLYANSWGPRLEYILRNTVVTLLELPEATLVDALRLLSDKKWRDKKLQQVNDPVMLNFWKYEFDAYTDKLRTEAISPIQNKIGQFVTSRMIRNIIGSTKSTIDLQTIMDEGKILILNLSQGKLGEDNASLLGAMIITQIQLAAMNRAFTKEEHRKDFFLYVDEFQNFATTSFVKILSEARKYRLALTLTNQYIEQLDEDIQRAVFGNVGTLISFVMGSRDAELFSKEFASLYTPADLVNLGKHEILLKLCIDNMTSPPFPAKTLALPSLRNENREKIIRLSKERYGRKIEDDSVSNSTQ